MRGRHNKIGVGETLCTENEHRGYFIQRKKERDLSLMLLILTTTTKSDICPSPDTRNFEEVGGERVTGLQVQDLGSSRAAKGENPLVRIAIY